MDILTFISNIAWPLVVFIGLLLFLLFFKEPIRKILLTIKYLQIKDWIRMEREAPEETSDQKGEADQDFDLASEVEVISTYLLRSPHSFQWFRDNTEFYYSNAQFQRLIDMHPKILQRVNIVSRDEEKRKSTPSLPGMRLRKEYKEQYKEMLHKGN
jgi:hypothetical protein